jgi:hypothetical protein
MTRDYSYSAGSGMNGKKTIKITGNTYAHAADLRALGGTWNAKTKTWTVPVPMNNAACSALSYKLQQWGCTWK